MRYWIVLVTAAALMFCDGCAKPPNQAAASQLNPVLRIQSLPPADPHKFPDARKMQDWKNPYLIIRVDGVALLDTANNEQKLLTPDKLVEALGELPASSWPYGRAVAVAENSTSASEDDKAQLRKNRALVAGTLESLQVVINWVPSS